MSFLERIAACNTHDPDGFRPWRVAGETVGAVGPRVAALLAERCADVFAVGDEALTLAGDLDRASPAERGAAVDAALRALAADGVVRGWRDEPYPVAPFTAQAPVRAPLLEMERAAVPLFGVRAYGVHMTGYVRDPDGGCAVWVARRSPHKHTYPGMLDNTVAGGQPVGIGLADNLVKEAWEEAAIPEALARRAEPVGVISYRYREPRADGYEAVKPDVQYCYDLELPADFTPRNTDGEIADFELWPVARVLETVRDTTAFKFNCNLVVIDFLIRRGFLSPDTEPDYIAICAGLRR